MLTDGPSAMARSCSARSAIALTDCVSPKASERAVDLWTTPSVAHKVHSPNNNRPERNENCVTHVVGQKCYLCLRLLRVGVSRARCLWGSPHRSPLPQAGEGAHLRCRSSSSSFLRV